MTLHNSLWTSHCLVNTSLIKVLKVLQVFLTKRINNISSPNRYLIWVLFYSQMILVQLIKWWFFTDKRQNMELLITISWFNYYFKVHSLILISLSAAIICTTGRTQDDFDVQGTGDRLVLQDGSDLTTMPETEEDAGETVWTKGKCLPTMGRFVLLRSISYNFEI